MTLPAAPPFYQEAPLLTESALGVLVLSLTKQIVYVNAHAHRLLEDLQHRDQASGTTADTCLPNPLAAVCDELIVQLGSPSNQTRWPSIQIQRCLMGKTASILVRGVGLPDMLDPKHGKLIVMLDHIGSHSIARPAIRSHAALSFREQSVVEGMAAGLTNKQIGARLNLREGTVKEYVKRIRMKIGPLSRGRVRSHIKRLPIDRAIAFLSGGSPPSKKQKHLPA